MKKITSVAPIFRCPVCTNEYDTEAKAIACANSTPAPQFEVGEFVLVPGCGYHWFDGDYRWVKGADKQHGALRQDPYDFYFVVTHIDQPKRDKWGSHQNRYHVATLALKNGMTPCYHGWTCDTHKGIVRLPLKDVPAIVRGAAPKLLGLHSDHLL